MSHDCCVALSRGAMGLSAVCDCGHWYFLIILTYYFLEKYNFMHFERQNYTFFLKYVCVYPPFFFFHRKVRILRKECTIDQQGGKIYFQNCYHKHTHIFFYVALGKLGKFGLTGNNSIQ